MLRDARVALLSKAAHRARFPEEDSGGIRLEGSGSPRSSIFETAAREPEVAALPEAERAVLDLYLHGGKERVFLDPFAAEQRERLREVLAESALAVEDLSPPEREAVGWTARLADLADDAFEAPAPADEKPPREIRTAELQKDRAQAHLVIGFRGLTVRDKDRYALDVIVQLLAGQGGRLFLELRDRRGLAYTVSAVNIEGVAPGYFGVYIATAPEKFDESRLRLLEELKRLIELPPEERELEGARRCLIGNFAIDQQRNAVHAAHAALDSLYSLGAEAYRGYPEHIAAVTAEDILRVARRVVDLDAYTLAAVRP